MPNNDDLPATKRDLNELRVELRTEFCSDMQGLRGELRSDMQQLRDELHSDMRVLRDELHSDMQVLRDDLIEKMREMQTEVLRAFYDWARPVDARLRTLDELNTRFGLLEGRVTAIEKRNLGL